MMNPVESMAVSPLLLQGCLATKGSEERPARSRLPTATKQLEKTCGLIVFRPKTIFKPTIEKLLI